MEKEEECFETSFESAREYRSRKFSGNLDRIVATDAHPRRGEWIVCKNSRGRKGG